MPNLIDMLYCFRGVACYQDILKELDSFDDYYIDNYPRFENIVVCVSLNDPLSWDQWKNIAIRVENYPFLNELEVYETNGEPLIDGTDAIVENLLIRADVKATLAEWAWALGLDWDQIEYFATTVGYEVNTDSIENAILTERVVNRAYVRLGLPVPFPIIKN